MLVKNGNCCQYFQRWSISTTSHYHIRLRVLIVAGPFPDANPFCAMHNCLIHSQPLGEWMFSGNHHVDIMPAAKAMVKDRQQAIGIGRQVNTYYIGFLIDNMVEEAWILACESVVILLPHVGGQQIL